MVQIIGTWPNGDQLTATQRNSTVDGEWLDDRFGQAFDLDVTLIGPDVSSVALQLAARHTFWDGVQRVEFVRLSSAPYRGRDVPEFVRAAGDTLCTCSKPYRVHPQARFVSEDSDDSLYLRETCEGWVKL